MKLQKIWERFQERVETDEAFREAWLADPNGVFLRETGMSTAEFRQQMKPLDDADLANVSGGNVSFDYACPRRGCFQWFSTREEWMTHMREVHG